MTAIQEAINLTNVVDHLKVGVYINQLDDINDFSTARNIYFNKYCHERLGYTLQDIEELKDAFFAKITHPDDFASIIVSINYLIKNPNSQFACVYRSICKNGEIFWGYTITSVYRMRNNAPWQFVNIIFDVMEEMKTEQQLVILLKENSALKNKLLLSSLTKREKEIVSLIAAGKTDIEISNTLFISVHTSKSHRKNILHKLNLSRSSDLVRFAMENGLN